MNSWLAWRTKAAATRVALVAWIILSPFFSDAAAQSASSPSAGSASNGELRERWGVLADLAGRDFDGCAAGLTCRRQIAFQWVQPGRALVIESDIEGTRRTDTIRIDSDGTLRLVRDDHGAGYWPDAVATVSPDGSIMFLLAGTLVQSMRLASGSRLEVETGRQSTSHGYRRQALLRFIDTQFASAAARERVNRFRARLAAASPPPHLTGAPAALSTVQAGTPALPHRPEGTRVALVIGIGTYGTLGSLANPVNDAHAVAAALRSVGFDVELLTDPNQRAMRQAVLRLGERMSSVGAGGTGLFFFAGHGVQARGINYLIPSGAAISREADLALEAIPADSVLLQMQEAGVSTNILILDACRNMPLTRSFRNGARGLAQMEAPSGSFIAYSTAPGSVAMDGDLENSPFAAALVAELPRRGQPIEAIFRNVRRSVLAATGGAQTPWDASSLVDPFYFLPN